jgi:SWI/SNF-related matrix-associated actin-dependent regulator 1 of chromatin subfamily A
LKLLRQDDIYVFQCTFQEKDIAKEAGFTWNASKKVWWTKSFDLAYKLVQYASTELREELEAEYKKRLATFEQSSSIKLNKDIVLSCPSNLSYFDYQKTAIDFMLNRNNTLLSEPTGVGKTIEIIGLVNNSDINKILVICPNTLKLNWKRELEKWLVKDLSISVMSSTEYTESDIMIINYEILYKYVDSLSKEWDLVIVDESHKAKNEKTRIYKSLKVITKKAKKKVFATGTPVLNKPVELWTTIKELCPDLFPNKWFFLQTYCGAIQTRWGWDFSGASNLEDLQFKLRSTIMLRREKSDLLDLPPKIVQIVNLSSDDIKDIVENERNEIEKIKIEYESKLEKLNSPFLIFEALSKIRHKTAIAKTPKVLEFVEDILESGEKVVVFAHHKDVLQIIYDYFKDKAVKIDGDTKLEDRQKYIDEFQTNEKTKVFVGSILATGVGITLTAASKVVFAELDWVPANITQCEDRLYRIGTKSTVNVYHLVVDGTLDVVLAETIVRKQKMVDKVLDKSYVELGELLK